MALITQKNIVPTALILGLALLFIYLFLNFTTEGKNLIAWLSVNYSNAVAVICILVVAYLLLSRSRVAARLPRNVVLRKSCEDRLGGLGCHNVEFYHIQSRVRATWIEKLSCYLFIGPLGIFGRQVGFTMPNQESAVLLHGMNDQMAGWVNREYEGGVLTRKEVDELRKKDLDSADALQILTQNSKANKEAVEQFLDTGGNSA